MRIVEFPDEGGGSLLVQVAEAGPNELTTRGIHVTQTVEKVEHSCGSVLGAIRSGGERRPRSTERHGP